VEAGSHLFRIAQEAVNNALKHAAPSEIRIGLEQNEGRLVLEIEDDGSGLDESQPAADGLGLRVMRYRARLIGAVLEAGTAAAGGTCIRCTLPLPITS
jgi:signal transduction histidine kinase